LRSKKNENITIKQSNTLTIKQFKIMARISGVDLPKNKRGVIGLTYIFGIGSTRAKEILSKCTIDESGKGLPLRGQRTQTNARTRKGKKKTVANKKKATK